MSVAIAAGVVFALSAGAASTATSWTGVVVAKDPARKAVVTASAEGTVRTLRVASLARFAVGQRLLVRAGKLRDGSFRSHVTKVAGRASRTKLRGTVVRHQPALRRYLLSAGSSVLSVRVAAVRRTASASARGPRAGDQVVMSLSLTSGTPTATSVQIVGHTGTLELEGIFLGLTADGSIRLAVAQRGEVVVAVPSGTQPPAAKPGDELEIDVTVDATGGFTLADEAGEEAEDDESVDTPSIDDDESLDTPSVDDDESVDTPSVDDDSVDTPSVDDDSVDTPSVDDESVDEASEDDVSDD